MTWQVQFLEAAQKDFERLDGSQKQETAKAICKVSQNPLPASEGGYGKPLGAHTDTNLVGLLKIKLKQIMMIILTQAKYLRMTWIQVVRVNKEIHSLKKPRL